MNTMSSAFQNSTKCMSKSTTKCKEKGGAKSTFGINRNGKRFILWCGLCAKKEYTERALLPEQQASTHKLCIVCNDSRPTFGLPGSTSKTQTHCKKCLKSICTATGIKLDMCVDFHNKCIVCKTSRPNYGLPNAEFATHCKPCLAAHCTAMGTELDACVDFNKKCIVCKKSQPCYGLPDSTSQTHCKPCLKSICTATGTELDACADFNKKCIVCKKSRPNYGLPNAEIATHCKPCLVAHCTAMGIELDACADFQKKCTHVGCTRSATQGMTWAPRLYCASHARDAWVCGNVPFPNRVNSSGKMPTASKSYSRVSIEFLDWLSLQLGIHIQHAESKDDDGDEEGEHKLVVAGRKFKADGFCDVNGLRVCIEFQGCVWHGCTECFADRDTAIKGKTRDERLHETLIRAEAVRATGYDLIEIWEHEWDEMENNEALKATFVNQVRKQLQLDSAVCSAPSSAPIQIQKTLFDVGFRAGQKRTRE